MCRYFLNSHESTEEDLTYSLPHRGRVGERGSNKVKILFNPLSLTLSRRERDSFFGLYGFYFSVFFRGFRGHSFYFFRLKGY
jgi:hypothetical protein